VVAIFLLAFDAGVIQIYVFVLKFRKVLLILCYVIALQRSLLKLFFSFHVVSSLVQKHLVFEVC
jgi:hypothetical protein